MNSATLVGRAGPLAAALALGAGIFVGGAGIAAADVGDSGTARASAETSTPRSTS